MKEIICEAGSSFHGLIGATQLIYRAKEAGANACKFQIYNDRVIKQAPEKWQAHLKKVHLHKDAVETLLSIGKKVGIEVFFTVMFPEAVDWCEDLGVSRFKVRAADACNDSILFKIRKTQKPCYVSRINKDSFDPIKQKNFFSIFYDKARPTKYADVFKGYSNLLKADGYSCHQPKLLGVMQTMMMPGIDYVEVHCSLDVRDKTLPDQAYSYPFTDVLELVLWLDILNKASPRVSRPKFELA